MRACGEKFIGIFRRDESSTGWVGFLTWRLGFHGPYVVRGATETKLREKLLHLDPTAEFYARGRSHGFDAPPVREEG